MKILIGNAFSMTLIRNHQVTIGEIEISELKSLALSNGVVSYWGHENSRKAAEGVLGVSLATKVMRPAIELSPEGYPMLYGEEYSECYVLSPEYKSNFRPAIGVEVPADAIAAWHALHVRWDRTNDADKLNSKGK